jgi:hypothetical protein
MLSNPIVRMTETSGSPLPLRMLYVLALILPLMILVCPLSLRRVRVRIVVVVLSVLLFPFICAIVCIFHVVELPGRCCCRRLVLVLRRSFGRITSLCVACLNDLNDMQY